MTDTKLDRLEGVLAELIAASPGIDAAAVVSFDGLMMASALPPSLDDSRVGAMSAALLTLGEQAVQGFGCGHLDQLFAEGEDGFVVMLSARDEAVLTAVAQRDAKVGLVLYEMRRAAEHVADILSADILSADMLSGDMRSADTRSADMRSAPAPVLNPMARMVQSRPIFAPEDVPALPSGGGLMHRPVPTAAGPLGSATAPGPHSNGHPVDPLPARTSPPAAWR